ncbi:NUDIX domain-containing protein [Pontibacter akesuensis]|uniref:8-oxo-dGTP diphosphatase n=1 Tax=Pontibacter akesuensis TaxID=388950 RepID=A0A1I7FXB9_9BACT|nr:NUDIX domain-containing protein [Pontibacter akesuensis]GHA60014.1 hypothetical protein GCM10007389_10230 [Pontibacter akesuensis]SFU40882.1 8-oxo-dGTP diphosphatase [Pontibacter akesuensis]
MADLNPNVLPYAEQLRVRVCGICIEDNKLLLVRHGKTVDNEAFWAPPGGGLQFGESMRACLVRELQEEAGVQVQVKRFLFVNEFLHPPLHAIEFFFEVQLTDGTIITGTDPEAASDKQLIEQVEWLTIKQIQQLPLQDKHQALRHLFSLDDLLGMKHTFKA